MKKSLNLLVSHSIDNLTSINLQNGNNANLVGFQAQNNPNLSCLLVDSPAFSIASWLNNQQESEIHLFPNPTDTLRTIPNKS